MREELDKQLVEMYPRIFKDQWYFECGDGWYNIIDQMCDNIQHHINYTRSQRHDALVYNRALSRAMHGDFSTFNSLSEFQQRWITEALEDPEPQLKIVPKARLQVVARQVKEKFGTLRFYYDGGDDIVDGIVRMAESMSAVTCGTCGAPGEARRSGWIKTLCDTHAKENER